LQGADGVGTLIFDEIDTGISGKISQKVGFKLKQTAQSTQVLCVTHAAQIAALAHTHILVSKSEVDGRTETALTPLAGEARVHALATMMGGAQITPTLLSSARELMQATPDA
jgi:DNA repair protein RecN (Recombination protein N)